jgi:hypothetical protein
MSERTRTHATFALECNYPVPVDRVWAGEVVAQAIELRPLRSTLGHKPLKVGIFLTRLPSRSFSFGDSPCVPLT